MIITPMIVAVFIHGDTASSQGMVSGNEKIPSFEMGWFEGAPMDCNTSICEPWIDRDWLSIDGDMRLNLWWFVDDCRGLLLGNSLREKLGNIIYCGGFWKLLKCQMDSRLFERSASEKDSVRWMLGWFWQSSSTSNLPQVQDARSIESQKPPEPEKKDENVSETSRERSDCFWMPFSHAQKDRKVHHQLFE